MQHGQSPSYGKRGQLIYSLFRGLKLGTLRLLLMVMIGLFDVTRWWWKARNTNRYEFAPRVFVGFGAGSEERMWQTFEKESCRPAIHLDQTKAESFGSLGCPNLMTLWKEVWLHALRSTRFLRITHIEFIRACQTDFLTFASMRVGQYVFFRQWWIDTRLQDIEHVVFISADTPAFACLSAEINSVEFRQHGLLRKSVVMPPFNTMKLLTQDEKEYFQPLMGEAKIDVELDGGRVEGHERVLLLASCYEAPDFHKEDYLTVLNVLFEWVEKKGMKILIRRHPCEHDNFWQTNFPDISIDDDTDSFEDAMLRIKPMMMITWFSTTLIDALRCNVVPVSISHVDNRYVQDLIVTLSEYCLMWPEQIPVLDSLVSGNVTIDEIVHGLSGLKRVAREA